MKAEGRRRKRRSRREGEEVGRWCCVRVAMEVTVWRDLDRGGGFSSSGNSVSDGCESSSLASASWSSEDGGIGRGSRWGFSVSLSRRWVARSAMLGGL